MKRLSGFVMALIVVSAAAGHQAVLADGPGESREGQPRFQVTVTNLTARQVFTPILVASHTGNVHVFRLGGPASVELEQLAEGGNIQPLATRLGASPSVGDVASSGALPPGMSVSIEVAGGGRFDHVSVGAMLIPTNDAFFAANGVRAPDGNRSLTIYSPAYDAGTEMNDEDCSSIPGPEGVCGGEGFNASRAGAEGFVHVHRGIHGIANLNAATYDWRNPVARIVIRRIR